jgi:indolepyruvate ferredoxin oxidoreductase beta subunit
MSAVLPITLQIAALGGQGGGVLADWLADAAKLAGYPAQVTSIPGVAQRTGATTYYCEVFPEPDPPRPPVFSLFPDIDGLDLLAALEPLEAARALNAGLVTARTTVITATDRVFATAEKAVAGDGTIPAADLMAVLERAAGRLVRLDVAALTGRPGAPGNAVLLGAIAASGVLPFPAESCRQAVERRGVAVAASLADFAAGGEAVAGPPAEAGEAEDGVRYDPPPDGFEAEIARAPAALQPLIGHALARLVDYQDADYARLYLDRLAPFLEDGEAALAGEVARRLAAWMTYEDVARVAQLKTRPGRLARVRGELGLAADAPLKLLDFLRPGREEMASMLPAGLGRLIARPAAKEGKGLALRIKTSQPLGYAMLKGMAASRAWRRRSYRWGLEQRAIESWLEAVALARRGEPALALLTAELAVLARGYGGVRARGLARLERLFGQWEARLAREPESLAEEARVILRQARRDPDAWIAEEKGRPLERPTRMRTWP